MVYTGYEGYSYHSAQAMGMHMPPSGTVYFMVEEPEEVPLTPSIAEVRSFLDEDFNKHPLEHIWTVWHRYEGYSYHSAQAMGMHMPPSGTVYFMVEEPEEVPLTPSIAEVRSFLDEDFNKHPLEHIWTVWHWENDRSKSWGDMLSEVTSFDTVEDFFSVYYFIKPPSDLRVLNDYMVFKHGVRCKLRNLVGTVLSREVHVRGGKSK
ncbi:GL22541 [Drosophila persimilis]|uniref:GL22541 n=1 Tax=Drosophila persimilis TaxID=7234 RepID=B4H163_DROPE|nr:GL22541 [Drosophila persimilis]